MQLIVSKEINYVEEANYLLFNYVNQISYEKMKEEGRRKLTNISEQYDLRFQHIIKINNYVTEYMRFDKSRLEYYFKEIGNSQISLANYILPLFPIIQYSSLVEYVNAAKSMNNKEVIREFDDKISEYYSIGKSGDEGDVDTFEDMTRAMDKIDISADDKWKIIQAYLDRDKHIDEISYIFSKTIELIKECKNEVNELEKGFYDYWSNYITTTDFLKELQDFANISWEYNKEGTLIIPILFKPHTITFSINDEADKRIDIIHLGVNLDSNLIFEPTKVDSERLNTALKILSDKSKFQILMYIKDKPAYGFELANALNLSTSTISYHMSGLISERLVKLEKDANKIYYSIDKEKIEGILEDVRILLLK